jgi:hypothetical protein
MTPNRATLAECLPPALLAGARNLPRARHVLPRCDDRHDPVPGSGLASAAADLDGTPVTDRQPVDLFWSSLGPHALTGTAVDVAGWKTVRSDRVDLVATFGSLAFTIEELRRRGEIRPDQEWWLNAEVQSAAALDAAGWRGLSDRALGELLERLAARAGKGLSRRAVDLLSQDATYVRAHLR